MEDAEFLDSLERMMEKITVESGVGT